MTYEVTHDYILNGKISIFQPKNGYRIAVDPILLSSFVNVTDYQTVLDVGCGAGAISLILKYKNRNAKITAIDVDEDICKICRENAKNNSLELNIVNVAVQNFQQNISSQIMLFDHVVTNPPFFELKSSRISSKKILSNFETIELADWIFFCLKKLKHGGSFSIIHNASRVSDILCALEKKVGSIEIIPIFPREHSFAKRVIVKCIKGSKSQNKIHRGLILHDNNGKYTEVAEKILSGL